jgi:hypothetical protein
VKGKVLADDAFVELERFFVLHLMILIIIEEGLADGRSAILPIDNGY